MKRRHLGVLLFFVLCGSPETALGQAICADCRVRVTAPAVPDGQIEARAARISSDTLFLQAERSLALRLSEVSKVEVYAGTRGHAGSGALVGGGLLGVTALAVGFSLQSSHECLIDIGFGSGTCEYSTGEVFAFGAVSAAVGAGLGAIIGAAIRTARWEAVPLESLRVEPTADGVTTFMTLPLKLIL